MSVDQQLPAVYLRSSWETNLNPTCWDDASRGFFFITNPNNAPLKGKSVNPSNSPYISSVSFPQMGNLMTGFFNPPWLRKNGKISQNWSQHAHLSSNPWESKAPTRATKGLIRGLLRDKDDG